MHRTSGGFCRGYSEKISEQIEQLLWFTEYPDEIEADFAAIYHIPNIEEVDGPKFVRFALRLPYYQGAVMGKIKVDYQEQLDEEENGPAPSKNTSKVSMSEAMGKYSDELDALNYESEANMMGSLFERVAVTPET